MSFSHWELCQFSFHYPTMGLNPHYHNKLYFYRHVQTETAFQGIRLNFHMASSVFREYRSPTVAPPLTYLFFFFWHKKHAANGILNSRLILHVVFSKQRCRMISLFAFLKKFHCRTYLDTVVTLVILVSLLTCQEVHVKDFFFFLSDNIEKLLGNMYQALSDNTFTHPTWQHVQQLL